MGKISKATKKNWRRLNVDETTKKLEHRANKTMSKKRIIPVELFNNKKNKKIITSYIEYIEENYNIQTDIEKIMRTFCIKWLIQNELLSESFTSSKININNFLKENNDIYIDLLRFKLPTDEEDILGIIYQCLQFEGEKNKQGAYYTPKVIVNKMIEDIEITENTKVLDPCCGTGIFLLESNLENPENLWGVDIDSIAVMIAKVNLLIKYKEIDFTPNIYLKDFLNDNMEFLQKENFDYIITNPPWGADTDYISNTLYPEIQSGESFSYMLIKASRIIKPKGKIIFLLPESFMNVKTHLDIRKYLITRMKIKKIILYPSSFSGVLTKFISVSVAKEELENYEFQITNLEEEFFEKTEDIKESSNFVITKTNNMDKQILKKVFTGEYNTLKDSIWALGIVTGNNVEKLKKVPSEKLEEIYTGKEISQYRLLPCKNYIEYKRENFQQVAPDRIYRSKEKLVYKFISKNLTFAYDNKQSLFLNSANILIPEIEGMSTKTCMAFLNSDLFKYIYMKKFGEIKILKGNLMQLPFPVIDNNENLEIEKMVDEVLNSNDEYKEMINNKIYEIFNITSEEIAYIKNQI